MVLNSLNFCLSGKAFDFSIKFKEIFKNFTNMGKETVNQVQEAQIVPGRINRRRNTQRHIVIKLTKIKDKDKILKATRGK